MAYEMKEGDISIFRNADATGNQPTYRGICLVDGKEKEISLWVKESGENSKNPGTKFFQGKIKEKYVKPNGEAPPPEAEVEDDLPF